VNDRGVQPYFPRWYNYVRPIALFLVNLLGEHFGSASIAMACQASARRGGTEASMSDSISTREPVFQFPRSQTVEPNATGRRRYDALAAALQASLAREDALRKQKRDLSQRHVMLAREFEHRITNGLQLIASLLSLQSRTMPTPEARTQLSIAARRVVALGTVHHRLHPLDQSRHVEFKEFLTGLCDDLSDLLFENRTDHAIVVEGTRVELPSAFASTLGLITSELITNAVKYANGDIVVRVEKAAPGTYSLSVQDAGPGLPAGFDSARSKGLGMKIIGSLAKQIDGKLQITAGEDGRGTRCTITFCAPR
jgi:two-component sensor histidine kinase